MSYFDLLSAAVLIGLASAAVWRLMAVDVITKKIRVKLFGDAEDRTESALLLWLHTWWKCPWCAGAWITAAITAATAQVASLPLPVLVFAAARFVTGWIGSKDEDYQDQMMRGEV